MAEGCSQHCSKLMLLAFNFLVFVSGICMLAVGIWLLVDNDAQKHMEVINSNWDSSQLRSASVAILIVGLIVSAISFCGCCGAAKENACLLITYAIVLGLILIVQIGAAITAVVFKDEISKGLGKAMNETVQTKYGQDGWSDATESWDYFQVELKCCGTNDYRDWKTSMWKMNQTGINENVPETCCVLKNSDPLKPKPKNPQQCQLDALLDITQHSNSLHTKGCKKAFEDYVHSLADILIGVAFGLAFVLMLGIICSCVLGCAKRRQRSGYQYV